MSSATPRMVQVRFGDEQAQALVAEVQQEYVRLYGGPDVTPLEESTFEPPGGAFFLACAGDPERPVAMGGWRRRHDDVTPWGRTQVAEIKRMYVVPAARRRGLARAVLSHLEETAREAGADAMVLETGTQQPEAIAMYVAAGYELIDDYGVYALSPMVRSFAKRL